MTAVAAVLAGPAQAQDQIQSELAQKPDSGDGVGGGLYFVYGQLWASLVSEKLGTNISTQQTQGPNQNIILSDSKQIDFGMAATGVALQTWEGKGARTQGKQYRNIRGMFPMCDTPFHFVTLEKIRSNRFLISLAKNPALARARAPVARIFR